MDGLTEQQMFEAVKYIPQIITNSPSPSAITTPKRIVKTIQLASEKQSVYKSALFGNQLELEMTTKDLIKDRLQLKVKRLALDFACSVCSKLFISERARKQHILVEHDNWDWVLKDSDSDSNKEDNNWTLRLSSDSEEGE